MEPICTAIAIGAAVVGAIIAGNKSSSNNDDYTGHSETEETVDKRGDRDGAGLGGGGWR